MPVASYRRRDGIILLYVFQRRLSCVVKSDPGKIRTTIFYISFGHADYRGHLLNNQHCEQTAGPPPCIQQKSPCRKTGRGIFYMFQFDKCGRTVGEQRYSRLRRQPFYSNLLKTAMPYDTGSPKQPFGSRFFLSGQCTAVFQQTTRGRPCVQA